MYLNGSPVIICQSDLDKDIRYYVNRFMRAVR